MTLAVAMPTAAELMTRALEKYNRLQPRDREGQWTDGMPDDLVSIPVKVLGGELTASSRHGAEGKATLSANGRSVDLDSREIDELRRMVSAAQYGDDGKASSGGVFRLTRTSLGDDGKANSEILVSLRPVEGAYISETGKRGTSLDDPSLPDDEEIYPAEFDLVVGEGDDGDFDDYPKTRVSLKDLDQDNRKGIYELLTNATVARRVDTGNGPTDVFAPRPGAVGLRMRDDNGDPTEVTFNARDVRRLDSAISDVLYGEGEGLLDDEMAIPRDDRITVETSGGPVEVRFKGRKQDGEWEGTLTVFPLGGAPWSVAVDGSHIDEFNEAFDDNGRTARILEGVTRVLYPGTRALEVLSSPAVQLMMLARSLEAADSFLRRGHRISVNRGRGGKFAEKIGDDIGDAVKSAIQPSAPEKKPRRSAVAKAMASGDLSALSGFDREPLRREARARGIVVPHGAPPDVIRDMLWDNDHAEYAATFHAPDPAREQSGLSAEMAAKHRIVLMAMDEVPEQHGGVDLAGLGQHLIRGAVRDGIIEQLGEGRRPDSYRLVHANRDDGRAGGLPTVKAPTARPSRAKADKPDADEVNRLTAQIMRSTDKAEIKELTARRSELAGQIMFGSPAPQPKPRSSRAKADKPDLDSVLSTLADKRANPQPGDREAVAEILGSLKSHAEIDAVAERFGYTNMKGTREKKRAELVETLVGRRLDTDAILRGGKTDTEAPLPRPREGSPAWMWDAYNAQQASKRAERGQSEFGRMAAFHKASMDADRERALAKRADAAVAAAPKRSGTRKPKQSSDEEFAANMAAVSGHDDIWAELRKAHEEEGMSARQSSPAVRNPQNRDYKLVSKPRRQTFEERAADMAAIAGDPDIWGKIRQQRADADAAPKRRSKADTPSAIDALRSRVDNPQSGDREETDKILAPLTGKQLDEVAAAYGVDVTRFRNVAQKRTQLRETLVGRKLDSKVFGSGTYEPEGVHAERFERNLDFLRKSAAAGQTPVTDLTGTGEPSGSRKTPGARMVMGTKMSPPMQQALVNVEDSGGLEMRRAEFINDFKLSEREFDQLVDNGFIEEDPEAGMGFIGITARGLQALKQL